MAQFFVRVELHGIRHDSNVYQTLRSEMEKRKFLRCAPFDKGWMELPPAEYYKSGQNLEEDIVLKDALQAAAIATKDLPEVAGQQGKYAVLVITGASYRGHGLKPVVKLAKPPVGPKIRKVVISYPKGWITKTQKDH